MNVVLLPIVHRVGVSGVLAAGLLAGVFLIVAGVLKLGSHIHRLLVSMIEGFTAGIAIVIALQQVPVVWGLHERGAHTIMAAVDSLVNTKHLVSPSVVMALLTAAVLIALRHQWTLWPKSLAVVGLATVVSLVFKLDVPTVGGHARKFVQLLD